MQVSYFDPHELKVKIKAVPPLGWFPAGFGGVKAEHFTSVEHQEKAKRVHATSQPVINESAYELCVELSVLQALHVNRMVFMELGAGWGAQALNIVTAVRNQVVAMTVKEVWSIAVEAEPGHYEFLCETFLQNAMEGMPVFGAVDERLGWPSFYAVHPPAHNYGQALNPKGNVTVPAFTLKNLLETFHVEEVDFVHMDIQGAEPQVLRGAGDLLSRFCYLLVCPHYDPHVKEIAEILAPTHNLVVSFGPASGYHEVEGFPLPVHFPQDGLMLFERKDLA